MAAADGEMRVVWVDFSSYLELRRRRETGAERRRPEEVGVFGYSVWFRELDSNTLFAEIAAGRLLREPRRALSQVRYAVNYLASENVIAGGHVANPS